MLPDHRNWFTEASTETGIGFSLHTKEKLHSEQTPYQTIDIYATETFGNLMVIDGFVMLSTRDNFLYHEMMSHPVIFSHPHPRKVVIIGGGDCGTLQEVLKHPAIQQVTQIDIDERVTRLSELYFPELCQANHDPRAKLLFADGIQWMQQADAGSVDIIIVDSTDPIGPAEGLFQQPFYQECLRVLASDGILVQQSESPLLHLESIIQPMHQAMSSAGFATVRTLHFPQPVYPSGWWSATLAYRNAKVDFRELDAQNKGFDTRYYDAAMHHCAFVLPPFMK
ncbi:polyamine aminopropyltransferase [Candidatus Venteria ishoeyi]|uniref:Polyamine aminopropyltransferase n=1 Tax=Candidatus Venteria ishoeyi TaxID=1899563 RepID=A0A1H6F9S4_9GAMM|nr:polyamine aminopropyltransferase [Candidatus Venteria ishoeyi]SEH05774.1 Spermidine synthase [Candidatus Venteria ishoeyi]